MLSKKEKNGFRQQASGSIGTPDELTDYLHVTVPGVWMFLIAVIILLLGVLIWSIYGSIETHDEAAVSISETAQICYIPENDLSAVLDNKIVEINGKDYTLQLDHLIPQIVTEEMDIYVMLSGHLKLGEYVYPVPILDCKLKSGAYQGHLKTETIKPFSFITK